MSSLGGGSQNEKLRSLGWAGLCTLFFILSVFHVKNAHALSYFGRIMVGDYFDSETLNQPAFNQSTSNDFEILSTRLYFKASDIGSQNLETTVDIRDKDDFFDKLDSENLRLTPTHQFQAYQLNIKIPSNTTGFYGTAGRFYVPEAGGEFTDGGEIGYRWSQSWRTALFGGLFPKPQEQSYVGFDTNSQVAGAYSLFQPSNSSWSENLYWANAFVAENVQEHLDRLYFYNNLIYQWSSTGQVFALVYVDFVPNIYVQTALVSLNQSLSDIWSLQASLTLVDVIEYSRIQGVLETLPSSPYREGSINFRANTGGAAFWDTQLTYGEREADELQKAEIQTGPSIFRLVDDHVNVKLGLGGGKNFISNDLFTQDSLGYFSNDWEFDASMNYTLSANDFGLMYHKWYTELSVARYFSREFFANLAVERAVDEQVSLWSGYVKLSYNFGERNTAPLRDTAPLRNPPLPTGRLYTSPILPPNGGKP
jgi:hypothetical protein